MNRLYDYVCQPFIQNNPLGNVVDNEDSVVFTSQVVFPPDVVVNNSTLPCLDDYSPGQIEICTTLGCSQINVFQEAAGVYSGRLLNFTPCKLEVRIKLSCNITDLVTEITIFNPKEKSNVSKPIYLASVSGDDMDPGDDFVPINIYNQSPGQDVWWCGNEVDPLVYLRVL